MSGQVILVRHAETVANAARLWQGTSNGGFSAAGRTQVKRLTARIGGVAPLRVVSSDLGRAEATAGALGFDFDVDPRWREPDVGAWDGMTSEEIRTRHPMDLKALFDGEDVPLGGAERLSDVAARTREAFDEVAAEVAGGGTVVVVSHGIALLALIANLLGVRRPAPLQMMGNTGVTTFTITDHGPQLYTFNDMTHLEQATMRRRGETELLLVRHGRTAANVEQRWQGHGDWPLDETGTAQAQRLRFVLPAVDALYASPLARAAATATAIADIQGREIRYDDDLKEIGFGSWENLTMEEIAAADPDGWTVFAEGTDVARGGTGETFDSVRIRMTVAIDRIIENHKGATVAAVSHGGATRAYLAGVLGLTYADRARIHNMVNTGFSRFLYGNRGPVLASWNVAPHLGEGE